jgi:ParB-like chromosome segregation protein Spo0J
MSDKGKVISEGSGRRPEKYQLLPELPPEQFEALKADIAKRGVVVAVVMDEFGEIIDGHSRGLACRELGINDYPVEVRRGLSEAEKRALARNLNALRRHLSREQVRSLIADQLRDTPDWSNQRIADGLGVDGKTVASVRAGLAATSEIPRLDKTVGADGKARRAPPKRHRKNHSLPLAADELLLDDEDDDADEAAAPEPTQDKARRREERERRRNEREWEAFGAAAEKRAKFEHVIDLISMGVDPNSEKFAKLIREASLVTYESAGYDAPTAANVTLRDKRPREYLTEREVERLIATAKENRQGHRDATAILVAYRHGLRASELVGLRAISRNHVRNAQTALGAPRSPPAVRAAMDRPLRPVHVLMGCLPSRDGRHQSRPAVLAVAGARAWPG